MSKVYIFLADGFEEIEGLTVVDILRRAGIEIKMVSITDSIYVTGSHQIMVKADLLFQDVNYHDADLLVLPGGMPGTDHLMEHEGLDVLLREFHDKGKQLAAICAAPIVLGTKGILNGKKATCYPGHEEKLLGADIDKNAVVVNDGTVTTSRGMGTAIDFSLALIKQFQGEDQAKQMAGKIQFPYYC